MLENMVSPQMFIICSYTLCLSRMPHSIPRRRDSPLGKCPDAYISIKQLPFRTKLFITVDGKTVANIKKLDTCHILAGDNGNIRWGRKGQYELGFRINDPGTLHVLKISSIIVF